MDQSQANLREVGSINASPDKQSFVSPTGGVLSSEGSPSPDRLPEIGSVAAAKKKRVRTKKPYITDPEEDIEKKAAEAALRELQSVQAKLAQEQQAAAVKPAATSKPTAASETKRVESASGHLPEEGMLGYGELFQHRRSTTAMKNPKSEFTNDLEAQDVDEDESPK